jgi:hypothetical protein
MELQNLPRARPDEPIPRPPQPVVEEDEPRIERGWLETWRPPLVALQVKPRRFGAINVMSAVVVVGFLFFTQILFLLLLRGAL